MVDLVNLPFSSNPDFSFQQNPAKSHGFWMELSALLSWLDRFAC